MKRTHLALALLALAGCGRSSSETALAEVQRILAENREAHLKTDAELLASHLADTLISVDAGVISYQPKDSVRAMFRRYFEGATYSAWEDVEPPVVRIAPSGAMAWVIRKVRVEREEPSDSGRRTRRFVSAYTATYERRPTGFRMTSVTSTFLPSTDD